MNKEEYVYSPDGKLKYKCVTDYSVDGRNPRVMTRVDLRSEAEKEEDAKKASSDKRNIKRIRKKYQKFKGYIWDDVISEPSRLSHMRKAKKRVYKEIKKLKVDYNER